MKRITSFNWAPWLLYAALCASVSMAQALTCQSNLQQPSNPDEAYTNHGDGTVTHMPTGLMWKRCAEGQTWSGNTCTGSATTHAWAQALTLGNNSSFAGHTDWRLPNIRELRSLAEECRSDPSINDAIFPATPSSDFWSSSTFEYRSDWSWYISFSAGDTSYEVKSTPHAVRLVRGGQ